MFSALGVRPPFPSNYVAHIAAAPARRAVK